MRAAWLVVAVLTVGCDRTPAADTSPSTKAEPTSATPALEPTAEVTARVIPAEGGWRYELTATAPAPFVLKNTTPFDVTLKPSTGVSVTRPTLSRADFVEPEAAVKTVATSVTAPAGEHAIDADAAIYVCSAELCKRVDATLHTTFTIP